jgi:chromosome segregation ATPase
MTQKGIAMERRRGLDTRRLVVIVIFFCALAIPLFAVAGCDKQLARMEENQIKLQAMVAANARDLATISSQLDTGQGKINESIRTLDGDTQQVAGNVASVRDEQRQFRDAVAAGHEGLNRRIEHVEDNQQRTITSVGELQQAGKELAGDIAARHDTLYAALQDRDRQLAERYSALTSGQGRLFADVANVHTQLNTMTDDLAAGNSSLKEQVATGQQTLTTQIVGLSAGQQQIQTAADTLGTKTDRMAADLVDTRSSLQQTLGVSQEALTGQIAGLSASQQNLQTSVDTLGTKADRTVADLADTRSSLQETFRVSHETLTDQIAGLSASQQQLQTSVDALGTKADQTAVDLVDTRSSLQETLRVSREVLTGQIAASLQNQQALQSDVRDLNDKTDKLTTDIGGVSSEQTALHATVRTNHDAVVAAVAGLGDRQETLRNGIERMDGKADRAAGDIASLTAQQQSVYEAVKANQDSITPQLAEVAATTKQTARDVAALNNGQAGLQQSIQAGNAALTTRATELAENQQALQSRIDNLGRAAQQVASDVAKMTVGQDALHQSLKAHSDKAEQQAASLTRVQEEMRTSLDTLTATAGQTALDVIAMTTRQDTIQAALQSHKETLGAQMAQLADNQQQVQTSLDTVTATTGQASLDLLGVATRQDAIQAILQSNNETLGARMAQLADNQQQVQSSLDTVTATTGQASLDTITLNNGQGRLGQAVQAGRQEMADKLADMAQGQQKWSERLDAAQAKVVTIGDSVAALEQRIAKLQELLQTSIQGTTALLGTTSQQRLQFEAKVSQDMQAVIDSLAQVRQTQTSLQEQITQVQKSTQGQADSLRSVIEQMKPSPNANDRVRDEAPSVEDAAGASQAEPAPAEVKISNAADVPLAPELPQAAE